MATQIRAEETFFSLKVASPTGLDAIHETGELADRRGVLSPGEACLCTDRSQPFAAREANLRPQVAWQLGGIANVVDLYLLTLAGEHEDDYAVATTVGPFDTGFPEFSDQNLPGSQIRI